MFDKIKNLFTPNSNHVTLEQTNITNLISSLESNYNALSNNRFNNVNDRQRKLKVMTKSLSGMNKLLAIVQRFKVKS